MIPDTEQLSVDLKNEMAKLNENLEELDDIIKRLSFIDREIEHLIGVKSGRKIQSDYQGQEDRPENQSLCPRIQLLHGNKK